jgi:nucleotide-binding universal stress UspA family protein
MVHTKMLVPVDGSECSFRALEFGVEMARCFDADLHVVHFSDAETDATTSILDRARSLLDENTTADDPELVLAGEQMRRASSVGDAILDYVEEHEYDHVVMGHHGDGFIGQAIVGSAAEKVLHAEKVPVTVVP